MCQSKRSIFSFNFYQLITTVSKIVFILPLFFDFFFPPFWITTFYSLKNDEMVLNKETFFQLYFTASFDIKKIHGFDYSPLKQNDCCAFIFNVKK